MTNLEEAKQYINSIDTLIVNKLNANNYQNYVDDWNTWATIRTTPEPQPPQLMVFDQSAALAAFISWSDAMENAAEHGAKDPGTYDWLQFITFTQAAPLTLPAPPQAPSQLVGPDEGAGHRSRYRLRKQVVEPVFGQIKQGRGFRQFLLRGVSQVAGEWRLVCSAHNVLKLAGARG